MYDLAQHKQQRFVDQERYDDEYDEYLLWTSTFPHVMIRVNDPFQIPDIPSRNLLQHLSDAGSTPPASPLSVSYTMTPNFKFPADEDSESDHEKSPITPAKEISKPSDAQSKLDVKVAKRGLPTRKRSYSNFF